ncbi:DUF4097 family beta strand repeat-containing protein [Dictyobacter kobayashii]|uniref:DUF4097 domain-containing protein n=1 Tax=Dictyobacter kobayashii TaxID=2014872 RepID=A0A402AG22_9CHLR|nr:DUF4097 family beta strand repeat-containing protein [Dictyobacter kobayashii]GCE18070.1 hypothetical protein KDK_18700 [Dictyobacter kobayashii]
MSKPDSSYLETGQSSPKSQKKQQKSPQSDKAEQAEVQETPAPTDESVLEIPTTESDVAAPIQEEAQAEPIPSEPASEAASEPVSSESVPSEPALEAASEPVLVAPPAPPKSETGPWSPLSGRPPTPGWRFPRSSQNDLGIILLVTLLVALLMGMITVGLINRVGTQNSTESYFFQQQAHQKIIINNDTGTIHIHSQQNGPFGFQVSKYSEGMGLGLINTDVTYNQDGAKTTVNARLDPDYLFAGSRGVDIDATVPLDAAVEAYTTTGTITATGTVSQLSARTNNGSIVVENGAGNMTLQADTGSIATHNVRGQLNMTTRQGDIEMHEVQLSGQSAITVESGAITFDGSLERSGNYHFTTINGSINLSLPRSEAFHLTVSNGSGPVTNAFGRFTNGKNPQAPITVSTQRDAITIHQMK